MSQNITETKESKPNFERRLREIQRMLQVDRTSKELKRRIAYMKPCEKRVMKAAQRNAAILKAQRKKTGKGRRSLLHIFDSVY